MPERLDALKHWLEEELSFSEYTLKPASADASFRRYFRLSHNGASYIVMDAPPGKEDSHPFIRVSRLLFDVGLNVPEVVDADTGKGFLLLSDLGSRSYLDELSNATVERLYGDALGALATLQARIPEDAGLPAYDEALLMREMLLFRDWLLARHLGMDLSAQQQQLLDEVFGRLAGNALAQPQVCVHRDYHSRNLMVSDANNPGILDFQDAVIGPLTYDPVSLLRDCYIKWPRERVEDWALGYRDLALQTGILHQRHDDPREFLRWFDLMGMQRHLKAAGIFARLNHRDGKPGYLGDIPRTLSYVAEVAGRHEGLQPFGEFVENEVMARLTGA